MKNSEPDYQRIKRSLRHLEILRCLQINEPNGRSNDQILIRYLDRLALGGSTLEVRASIGELEQIGVVRTETVDEYVVVQLTDQGVRVASGEEVAEGVARPARTWP